jgi:predicted RNA binding protein YcfA (HicA-like mRNA interferase family)
MAFPACSGADMIRVFTRAGRNQMRQLGSHVTLVKSGSPLVLTVPIHRELDRGLLRSLIREAGMSVDEFSELLND